MSSNDGPGMVRFTVFDLNPIELNYYPSMITIHKSNVGSKRPH